MKYGGTFQGNFLNATGSGNTDYQKDVLLDEIASLIANNKQVVISALNETGYKVSPEAKQKTVIDGVSKALHESADFRNKISVELATGGNGFSNADGAFWDKFKGMFKGGGASGVTTGGNTSGGVASGAGAGATGGVVGAIAGAVGSIFGFASSQQQRKAEEEKTKQELYNKLLTDNQKTNWMPIIVVSGVLLIGGLVVFLTMRNKN